MPDVRTLFRGCWGIRAFGIGCTAGAEVDHDPLVDGDFDLLLVLDRDDLGADFGTAGNPLHGLARFAAATAAARRFDLGALARDAEVDALAAPGHLGDFFHFADDLAGHLAAFALAAAMMAAAEDAPTFRRQRQHDRQGQQGDACFREHGEFLAKRMAV